MTSPSREFLLRVARRTGLFRWMRGYHRDKLLVLTYHSVVRGVRQSRRRYPLVYRNAVDAERFEQQMRYLRQHYHPLNGTDLRTVLEGASPPDRAVVVTFDDGLINNKTVALPILNQLQIPAVFFLPTGFVDAASEGHLRRHWTEGLIAQLSHQTAEKKFNADFLHDHLPTLNQDLNTLSAPTAILHVVDHLKSLSRSQRNDRLVALRTELGDPPPASAFPADPAGHSVLATMTWDHARTVADSNVTLGGHTVNHESLSRLADSDAATEIEDSLNAIADRTGQSADLFSYPYGTERDFRDAHLEMLADVGCRGAFTQIVGFNDASTDPLALRRVDVSPNYNLGMFAYVTSGAKHTVDRLVRRQ